MTANTLHAFCLKAMRCGIVFTLFAVAITPVFAQETRTWVDATGKFKIEAVYQKVENENVLLKLTSGDLKQIPLSMLSSADQDYVDDLLNPAPAATTPSETSGAPKNSEASLGSAASPADIEQPKPVTPATPAASVTPAMPEIEPEIDPEVGEVNSISPTAGATDMLTDSNASAAASNPPEDEEMENMVAPEPVIFYGKRIGDLNIKDIEPPATKDGFRQNPKYLFKVEKKDLVLLPREFQGAAILLLNEPNEPRKAIAALDFLMVRWPKDRQPTLIKLVINCASSDHKFNRESALKILADRDPDQSFPYIFARVDDTSFTIRSLAYQMLRKVGDRRAIEPLASRFASDDVDRISSLLRSFGSASEDAVATFLADEDPDIRLKACNLIGKIGTSKSLPALEAMQQRETTMMLLAQTRSSINKIKRRSGAQVQ